MSIVYFCKTVRQLLAAFVHSRLYHNHGEKILFINEWLHVRFPDLQHSASELNFNKIVIYNTWDITDCNNADEDRLVGDIVKYYDALIKNNNVDFSQVSDFYLFASLRFSIYLSKKNISFNLMEDAEGVASKFGFVSWTPETDKVDKNKLAKKYGLLDGSSQLIKNTYANTSVNNYHELNSKTIDFSLLNSIKELPPEFISNLIKIFNNGNELHLSSNSVVLLSQNKLNFQYSGSVFWGLICDCFLPSDFFFKAHPGDDNQYPLLEDRSINKNLPSELLQYYGSIDFAGVSSSGLQFSHSKKYILGNEYLEYDPLFTKISLEILAKNGINELKYIGKYKDYFKLQYEKVFSKEYVECKSGFCISESENCTEKEYIQKTSKNSKYNCRFIVLNSSSIIESIYINTSNLQIFDIARIKLARSNLDAYIVPATVESATIAAVVVDLPIEFGNRDFQAFIGRSYRDGRGVPKDLDKAAEWMRKAAKQNLGWAKNELFDILWTINTPESLREMIDIGQAYADMGDGGAMGRIGRAYRYGRGVPKDLMKAANWMRKSREKKVLWADWELFEILYSINTPESIKEAISIAEPLANAGNAELQARMAIAYRDGRGVDKDLIKSAELMRAAYKKGISWAGKELCDILWQIDTPEADAEMISIAMSQAEKGNSEFEARMARAYRDGRGVPRDKEKAIALFRSAESKGIKWVSTELEKMNN